MGNERIIDGCSDDTPRGSQLKGGYILDLIERNQGEPFPYLPYDAYALGACDAGPKRQASQGGVNFAERVERAEITFSCIKE
jgi:hypothetical protein